MYDLQNHFILNYKDNIKNKKMYLFRNSNLCLVCCYCFYCIIYYRWVVARPLLPVLKFALPAALLHEAVTGEPAPADKQNEC
jgi:hypothetical protein